MFNNLIFSAFAVNILNYTSLFFLPVIFFFSTWYFVYYGLKFGLFRQGMLLGAAVMVNFLVLGLKVPSLIAVVNAGLIVFQMLSAFFLCRMILSGQTPEKYMLRYFSFILGISAVFFLVLILADYNAYKFLLFPESSKYLPMLKNFTAEQKIYAEKIFSMLRPVTFSLIMLTVFSGIILSFLLMRRLFLSNNLYVLGFDYKKMLFTRPSEYSVVFLIIALVFMIVGRRSFDTVDVIGRNMLVIAVIAYMFNGIMIFENFSFFSKLPKPLKIVIYIVSGIQISFSAIFLLLGLFDMWLDFRKLIMRLNLKTPGSA